MNKWRIGAGIIIVAVALVAYFFLAIYSPGAGMYVRAEKLTSAPDNYVEVNMTELDKYPFVKEAVMNLGKEIKVPSSDSSTSDFAEMLWNNNQTQNILVTLNASSTDADGDSLTYYMYKDTVNATTLYYQILIFCAD